MVLFDSKENAQAAKQNIRGLFEEPGIFGFEQFRPEEEDILELDVDSDEEFLVVKLSITEEAAMGFVESMIDLMWP